MAKEINQVTKGNSTFNIVGKAMINTYTFDLEKESKNSDWVYNKMQLKVKTANGDIQSEMMGGYGSDRNNVVYVHGKKKNDNGQMVDDFKNTYTIDWEDRFDEEIIEGVGDRSLITVGLEKDEKDKTVYKKFLTEYDAIKYIESVLEDGQVVNIKGDLSYQEYNDILSVKKNIKSITLSNTTEEDKFVATFTQTILVDNQGVGKPNKETRTVPIDSFVVDFTKKHDGKKIVKTVNGKRKEGINIPLNKTFDFKIGEDVEKAKKMVKYFKAKNKKVTEITVDGIFSKGNGLETVAVSRDDIPDDILELIELDMVDEKEILDKMAFANGGNNRVPEQMIILKPHVNMVKRGESKIPEIAVESDKYNEDDIILENVLEVNGAKFEEEEAYIDEDITSNEDPFGTTSEDEEEDEDWDF